MTDTINPTLLAAVLIAGLGLPPGASAQTTATADTLNRFAAPQIKRPGFEAADLGAVPPGRLIGQRVYSPREAWIGVISGLLTDASGKPGGLVINVGGFLGIAEKPVAIAISSITVTRAMDSGDLRIYLGLTDHQITALPVFDQ